MAWQKSLIGNSTKYGLLGLAAGVLYAGVLTAVSMKTTGDRHRISTATNASIDHILCFPNVQAMILDLEPFGKYIPQAYQDSIDACESLLHIQSIVRQPEAYNTDFVLFATDARYKLDESLKTLKNVFRQMHHEAGAQGKILTHRDRQNDSMASLLPWNKKALASHPVELMPADCDRKCRALFLYMLSIYDDIYRTVFSAPERYFRMEAPMSTVIQEWSEQNQLENQNQQQQDPYVYPEDTIPFVPHYAQQYAPQYPTPYGLQYTPQYTPTYGPPYDFQYDSQYPSQNPYP